MVDDISKSKKTKAGRSTFECLGHVLKTGLEEHLKASQPARLFP